MSRPRLAVLTTHPIQYQSPWFRALHEAPDLDLQVFFCHRATSAQQAEAGFGVEFEWDAPLLEGFSHSFLRNVSARPSALTFSGLDVPEIDAVVRRGGFSAMIVHGWHYKAAWQAMGACRRRRCPVMLRSDSHLRTPRSALKKLLKWPAYRLFIPRLDVCLPVGEWAREYFLHYGADPGRVVTLPHVIDFDWFADRAASLEPSRAKLREGWDLPAGDAVFLFAGKFIAKKRPMDFARAVLLASRAGAPVTGLMVGDGPLRSECESFVEQNRIPVRFAGFLNQSRIVEAYVAADALALVSDGGETWGLVANEAMACGKPCLVSDQVGCGPDLVKPGVTGDVFRCGDVDALASRMRQFSEPGRLASMRESVLRVARRYAAPAGVEATRRALRRALQ